MDFFPDHKKFARKSKSWFMELQIWQVVIWQVPEWHQVAWYDVMTSDLFAFNLQDMFLSSISGCWEVNCIIQNENMTDFVFIGNVQKSREIGHLLTLPDVGGPLWPPHFGNCRHSKFWKKTRADSTWLFLKSILETFRSKTGNINTPGWPGWPGCEMRSVICGGGAIWPPI